MSSVDDGMLDGETIETLWSLLKGMIGSTRGMSTSHRKEVLDDHMNDVNWEKTTRVGELMSVIGFAVITLTGNSPTVRATINRYNAAVTGVQNSVAEFRSLCESTPDNLIQDWTKLEKKAQKARRAVHDAPSSEDKNALLARLQIYDVTPRNCTSSILFLKYHWILTPRCSAFSGHCPVQRSGEGGTQYHSARNGSCHIGGYQDSRATVRIVFYYPMLISLLS